MIRKKGQPDGSKVNMHEDHEAMYWAKVLDVSKEELQKAIDKVGNSAAAVRRGVGSLTGAGAICLRSLEQGTRAFLCLIPARGTERLAACSPIRRRGNMRKALAELNDEERRALLYVADLGTAICLSGLIVSIVQFAGNLFYLM